MILAYNTNGFSGLSTVESIDRLAEIGYRGIAITIDHGLLNPFDSSLAEEVAAVKRALAQNQFRSVIETGARFLLDESVKHEPTLVSANPIGRARRIYFLRRAIDIAAELNSDCVSLWAGVVRDGAGDKEAMQRLVDGLSLVLEFADKRGVTIGFEPEPGMFIDTLARYADLLDELTARKINIDRFQLTIDIGHLHCMGEVPVADYLVRWADRLVNVHIEDMRAGVHEHLMFGEGEIDFRPVIATLRKIGYDGELGVELSRHSVEGLAVAKKAYQFLKPMLDADF